MKMKLVSEYDNIELLLPILKSIGYVELDGGFLTKNQLIVDTCTKTMRVDWTDNDIIEFDVTETLKDIEQWKQGKLICFKGLEGCYSFVCLLLENGFVRKYDADFLLNYQHWTIKDNELSCTSQFKDAIDISNPRLVHTLYELLTRKDSIIKVLSHTFNKEIVESYLVNYGHCIKKGSCVILGQGYDEFEIQVLCSTGKFGNFL